MNWVSDDSIHPSEREPGQSLVHESADAIVAGAEEIGSPCF